MRPLNIAKKPCFTAHNALYIISSSPDVSLVCFPRHTINIDSIYHCTGSYLGMLKTYQSGFSRFFAIVFVPRFYPYLSPNQVNHAAASPWLVAAGHRTIRLLFL
jgi:hypothetical protein